MSFRACAAILGFVTVLLYGNVSSTYGNEREVIQTIQTNHNAALAVIETFSCDVEIKYEPKNQLGDERGKCWRSGGNLRCIRENRLGKCDVIAQGSRVTSLDTTVNAGKIETSATITTDNRPIGCNPWSYGLLTFYGQKTFRVSLDDLLSQPHRLHSAKMIRENGKDFGYIELSHDHARLEIWFGPQVNYLVQKMVSHSPRSQGKKQRGEHVVSQFHEAAPGIFFPEKVSTRAYEGDRLIGSMSVVFSNIEVNKPLPADIFSLQYPPGILVSDLIQGKMFKTDDSGNPRLPPTDSKGRLLQLATVPPVAKPNNEDPPQVTHEEPRAWTRWLVPASLLVFGIAGICWLIERRRRRIKSAS